MSTDQWELSSTEIEQLSSTHCATFEAPLVAHIVYILYIYKNIYNKNQNIHTSYNTFQMTQAFKRSVEYRVRYTTQAQHIATIQSLIRVQNLLQRQATSIFSPQRIWGNYIQMYVKIYIMAFLRWGSVLERYVKVGRAIPHSNGFRKASLAKAVFNYFHPYGGHSKL